MMEEVKMKCFIGLKWFNVIGLKWFDDFIENIIEIIIENKNIFCLEVL